MVVVVVVVGSASWAVSVPPPNLVCYTSRSPRPPSLTERAYITVGTYALIYFSSAAQHEFLAVLPSIQVHQGQVIRRIPQNTITTIKQCLRHITSQTSQRGQSNSEKLLFLVLELPQVHSGLPCLSSMGTEQHEKCQSLVPFAEAITQPVSRPSLSDTPMSQSQTASTIVSQPDPVPSSIKKKSITYCVVGGPASIVPVESAKRKTEKPGR